MVGQIIWNYEDYKQELFKDFHALNADKQSIGRINEITLNMLMTIIEIPI